MKKTAVLQFIAGIGIYFMVDAVIGMTVLAIELNYFPQLLKYQAGIQ